MSDHLQNGVLSRENCKRKEWFQTVNCAIQNQKIKIESNPFLSTTMIIGKNVTYEFWIEIQAKVYHCRSVNEEIRHLNRILFLKFTSS